MAGMFEVLVAAVADKTDAELFDMIELMERTPRAERTGDESTVLTSLYMAIEARHDVDDAMNAWAADVDTNLTYGEALRQAVAA